MANLQGFAKVQKVPHRGESMYDELLDECVRTKGMYSRDTQDKDRAKSLSSTLRSVIRKRGLQGTIHAGVSNTIVFIEYKRKKEETNG